MSTGSTSGSGKPTDKAIEILTGKVYDDALQPTGKEVGKTLGGLVRVALSPLNGLVWGYDMMATYLEKAISEKLKYVDPLKIKIPPIGVAGPALEAMRFIGDNETLKDLFASLLANSMNSDKANESHPSFVEILKNLSSDEAIIIKFLIKHSPVTVAQVYQHDNPELQETVISRYFSFLNLPNMNGLRPDVDIRFCLENLMRLRIITIDMVYYSSMQEDFEKLTEHAKMIYGYLEGNGEYKLRFRPGAIYFTPFGSTFATCVTDSDIPNGTTHQS